MIDLSRDEVTIMSELSIGVAIAVTQSVWARRVPLSVSDSAISRVCWEGLCVERLGEAQGGSEEGDCWIERFIYGGFRVFWEVGVSGLCGVDFQGPN